MCGIGGIVTSRDPRGLREDVERIMDALRHRGPDGARIEGLEAGGAAAVLCATRLAVRDLSERGNQPMVSSSSGSAVAFNGEIYNADELRATLERDGREFAGNCDTEVVLAAFERWGADAIGRLRGIFACALWDPSEGALLLARDPLGVKPLYYTQHEGRLGFASEVRALAAARLRPTRLSPAGLEGLLATGAVEEPDTILEGIEMLPAGAMLRYRNGSASVGRFWSLDDAFGAEPLALSRDEAVERIRTELEAATARQLVSDAPLGVFLSGGLDSSALVGLTATVGRAPKTASLVFEDRALSEARWIDAVRRRWDTEHHQLELSGAEMRAQLPAALAAMDQPTVDGVNTFAISAIARRAAGLTVALSGLGGDELFAGYGLFREAPRLERARRGLPTLPRSAARLAGRAAAGRGDRARKLARWLAGDGRSAYALQRELLDPETRGRLLPSCDADRHEPGEGVADANGLSRLELSHYTRNILLRDSDVLSMAHGLELRVPLLDQQLVELMARIPSEYKLARGREKPLLVDAVRDLLPDEVLHRRKAGFTLPFESWLRGELCGEVKGRLLDPDYGGQIGAALRHDAVAEVWRRFAVGETNWARPWVLYVAKSWGERNLAR